MKHSSVGVALLCLAVVTFSATPAHAANTYPANSAGIAYNYNTGSSAYGHPGGMIITSNCNRYDPAFASARANGAEIISYVNAIEVTTSMHCANDATYYNGGYNNVPKWPYPTAGARANYPGSKLTDIRKGSAWSNRVVAYVEQLMREDRVDGVFLDVTGARLWTSLANWNSWPQWEKDQWTDGNVDLVRRLDASRRAINPNFIVINNGRWDRGDSRGIAGEKYVDGTVLEHHSSSSEYHRLQAGRTFSNLGHRRVLAVGKDRADTLAWRNVQGVTHVSDQATYKQVTAPVVGFTRLTDRPLRFGKSSSGGAIFSPGMSANYKRGSRFYLSEKGKVLNMAAYIDGKGGPSGSQQVRMALYKDNGGVPGTLVVQSNGLNISAGRNAGWVYFPTYPSNLTAGYYWVSLLSGSNNAVGRVASSGNANWHGNTDTYSDGAANPAGIGSRGTTTLNMFVNYTRGH